MAQNSLPKAVQDCHNLIVWLIPLLDNFPRNRRFTLGERLESGLLEILESLVEAAYARNKRDLLKHAAESCQYSIFTIILFNLGYLFWG